MNNSILAIRPYRMGSIWVFDDDNRGLYAEAFVGDVNLMIDAMLERADLPRSEPFTALFSAQRFPGAHMTLKWDAAEDGGNWYVDYSTQIRGWLCPALFKFFETAPQTIHVRAEP